METTKSYITKHTLLTKKKSQTVPRTPQNSRISTQLTPPASPIFNKLKQQESNLSPNFTKLKSWYEYVKKTIGTHGFLNELNLESGIKLTKSINQWCYHCRLNNHTHENCEPLKEYKRLALLAWTLMQGNIQWRKRMMTKHMIIIILITMTLIPILILVLVILVILLIILVLNVLENVVLIHQHHHVM